MAALDLLTLPEAKEAVNRDPARPGNDGELIRWITAMSLRVDELCGPVVERVIDSEQHFGDRTFIVPLHVPVASVTKIVEYTGTTPTTLTAEVFTTNSAAVTSFNYFLDPATSRIHRRSNGSPQTFASTRVVLTYVAGRAADTSSVDGRFKTAAGAMLRRLHSREAGAWSRGGNPLTGEGTDSMRVSAGFFKVIDPMIGEFLQDELQQGPTVPIVG